MFLTRNDVLDQLIELYNCLGFSNSHNLMDDTEAKELHCQIICSFLFNEIEDFSKTIMEDLLEIELFDFEFANKLYDFEQLLFQKIIKTAIKQYFSKFDFNGILKTVSNFKYDLQAIMGYEAIFEEIYNDSNDSKQSYDLSRKLQEMIAKPLFSQITADKRYRLTRMAECLPIYPEDLCETTKVLITNIGNKFHLNVEMVHDTTSPVDFLTLTFDLKKINWTLLHDRSENLFEIETPSGQILCWIKPFASILSRIIPAETTFMDKNKAKNSKWKIQYLEEGDPSKGFSIKAADQNIYLSAGRTGEFSVFVSVLKDLDLEERDRCAWKFQRIDYTTSS